VDSAAKNWDRAIYSHGSGSGVGVGAWELEVTSEGVTSNVTRAVTCTSPLPRSFTRRSYITVVTL